MFYSLLNSLFLTYIGPGAGIALVGSSSVILIAIIGAFFGILILPIRLILRSIRRRKLPKESKNRKVVVLGFDGMDYRLTKRFIDEGHLPNFKKLGDEGTFAPLKTTNPSLSPVAWSSFQTGVNPGAHNVFDFLSRDQRTYLPKLVSTDIEEKKTLFGKKSFYKLTRKSKPFWDILGKFGIFSHVIRVPISFPAEPFFGNILSAMCTPDIRGSQGTFQLLTTDRDRIVSATSGEIRELINSDQNIYSGQVFGPLETKLSLTAERIGDKVKITLGDFTGELILHEFSPWISVKFSKNLLGICKICIQEISPNLSIYVSPINIDPENQIMPVSAPKVFGSYLSKLQGKFGTLGFLEDTWARNEFALNDETFLKQALSNEEEREKMLRNILKRTKDGLIICVFDGTDRIQHMFWRYTENDHPAPLEDREKFQNTILNVYKRMDQVIAETKKDLKPNDILIVLSDHGFDSFRRSFHVNAWLHKEGYLVLKDGVKDTDYLQGVDWGKTKAYGLGLTGIYINKKGRERLGIIEDSEKLEEEIAGKLKALRDNGKSVFHEIYRSKEIYKGLYTKNAPDLILGYKPGYRVSWECVTGAIGEEVFTDNIKAWSGDHHIAPELIPGILLSNKKFEIHDPSILDLAPSILSLWGVRKSSHMEGTSIWQN
mgnify:CR=1 FL=1